MEIFNIRVYDLEESAVASGFPKLVKYPTAEEFSAAVLQVKKEGLENDHMKRLVRLASFEDGSGHKSALKGIIVNFNITAPVKWWMQAQRYNHFDIVSSMSTQHKLKELVELNTVRFSKDTSMEVIESFLHYVHQNKELSTAELSQASPMGIELCSRVTTNYLQLRTMWKQRHTHPLKEWQDFCKVIETLPYSTQLITNK